MKNTRTNRSDTPEYVVAFRVYVQADGSMVVYMGNQRLEVTPDGVHALLCGSLEYARVFATLHDEINETLEAITEDSTENGRVV